MLKIEMEKSEKVLLSSKFIMVNIEMSKPSRLLLVNGHNSVVPNMIRLEVNE